MDGSGIDEERAALLLIKLAEERIDPLVLTHLQTVPAVQPGSRLSDDDMLSSPYQLSHAVTLCLSVSVDNLHAMRSLVVQGTTPDYGVETRPYALFTLLRAALESACRVTWLLSPEDQTERLSRRLALLLASEEGRQSAAKVIGGDADRRTLEDEYLARMASSGVDLTALKASRLSSRAVLRAAREVMAADPSCKDFEKPLAALGAWQGLSGVAHGDLWAAMSLPRRDLITEDANGVTEVRIHTKASQILLWAMLTTGAVEHAARLLDRHRLRWTESST